MGVRHQILYTKLPSYNIAFDVYDTKSKRFLGVPEKHEVLKSLNWCYTPLIEGVVVKNYRKQLFGKAINKEFDEAIRGKPHYTRKKGELEKNKLYTGEEWPKLCHPCNHQE